MTLSGEPPSTSMSCSLHGLDDLLARREALAERFAAQALAHGVEERAHDAEFDVGFEQRGAHVARGPRRGRRR